MYVCVFVCGTPELCNNYGVESVDLSGTWKFDIFQDMLNYV